MTAKQKQIRSQVVSALGRLGPHLLAASNAADGPNPASAVGHFLGARAALTEAINAIEAHRVPARRALR